jgi:acyl-CoA thioester hydrolase
MIKTRVLFRVRYAEVDQMKFVYYGNYAIYFEVARVELLRSMGISYKQIEEQGVLMPVTDFEIKYKLPAKYDEEIEVQVSVTELPSAKMIFYYQTLRNEQVLNEAKTTLVFVNKVTGRPQRCPSQLLKTIQEHWQPQGSMQD